jgi:hypothetical protein
MHSINIFIQNRRLIETAVGDLSPEAYMTIPEGFDNNIAWNLGHIVVVQQSLLYRLSGLGMAVTPEDVAMFTRGTSPADWQHEPDIPYLLRLLRELPLQLQEDYAAGKFSHYQGLTTSMGVVLATIDDAIAYNNFHEGLHLGFIWALRNLVIGR